MSVTPSSTHSDSRGHHGAGRADDEFVFVFTREQIRALDRAATEEFHIAPVVLMENAARSSADEILRSLDEETEGERPKVAILCGSGNNGGDGLALARHLHNAGMEVSIILTFDPSQVASGSAAGDDHRGVGGGGGGRRVHMSDATLSNLRTCKAMNLPITAIGEISGTDVASRLRELTSGATILVDALLGTGAAGAPRQPIDLIINWMNEQEAMRVSIDIPSGLDCDTGAAAGACVRADLTITFAGLKAGFLELDAQPYIGEVAIGEIGAPFELAQRLGKRLLIEPHDDDDDDEDMHRERLSPAAEHSDDDDHSSHSPAQQHHHHRRGPGRDDDSPV